MRNLVRSLIGGAALLAAAPALAQPAAAPLDMHGEVELARELAQLCKQGLYFEQRLLAQAGRWYYPASVEAQIVKRDAATGEISVRNRERAARLAAARSLGCGADAAPALARGRDFLYLELASLLGVMREQAGAGQLRLTPEETALYNAAAGRLQTVYPQQLDTVAQMGVNMADTRQAVQGLNSTTVRFVPEFYAAERTALFDALRFQSAMQNAGWVPRVRFTGFSTGGDADAGAMEEVIELARAADTTPTRWEPTRRVIGRPQTLAVPLEGGSKTIADAVLLRDADGAMTLAFYGRDAAYLPATGITAQIVLKGTALSTMAEPVRAGECGFALCLRFAPAAEAAMAADTGWQSAQVRTTGGPSGAASANSRITFSRAQWDRARGQ